MLLGLLEPEPEPEPEPAAEAEPGAAGLPDGAAGPFPDDLGGGDRGRFLRKRSRRCNFYSCSLKYKMWVNAPLEIVPKKCDGITQPRRKSGQGHKVLLAPLLGPHPSSTSIPAVAVAAGN